MTIRQTAPPVRVPEKYGPEDQFPERPRRTDLQNSIYRERPGHITALARHYGSPDTILVLGDVPVRHTFQRGLGAQMLRYPDLIVAFGVNTAEVIARRGYAIDDQGKPPDFVLEIASIHTALNDYTSKRVDYAAYGIPEYWRFDPTDGERYPVGLAGEELVGGEYRPITIHTTEEGGYWGHSESLNLDICWEKGQMRLYDPAAQLYLLTHDGEAEGRIAAELRLVAAEARLDAERRARMAAEAEAAEVQARLRQLEDELKNRPQ